MGLELTIVILFIACAVFAGAIFINRKPVEPGQVRMIPYGGLQFLAIVAILVTLAHLITLLTGIPLIGRSGF
ncbi:MAG: hypothetical protein IID55_09820 [Proteobacteria bacterium]|nr:hypothetical protein [Pseudomonadota bacterium]